MRLHMIGPDGDWAWIEGVFTDDHAGRWLVAAAVAVREGHIRVGELRIFPAEREPGGGALPAAQRTAFKPGQWSRNVEHVPSRGLERRTLREIPMGRFPAHASKRIAERQKIPGADGELALGMLGYMLHGVENLQRPRPRRNVGRDDAFYAALASEYLAAVAEGMRGPVKRLAARRRQTPARMRDMVHEARDRGLLSRGEPGRPGGHLLPAAIKILRPAQSSNVSVKRVTRGRRRGGRR
jgi:hypothetical protein